MSENKKTSIGNRSTCHLLNIKDPTRATKRIKIGFQRSDVALTLVTSGKSVDATLTLVDISEGGAGVFTTKMLPKGVGVHLLVPQPLTLKIRAVVTWSVPVESGLNSTKFRFRSGLQFVYENDFQKNLVREFIQKIEKGASDWAKPAGESAPATGLEAPVASAPDATATPAGEVPAAAPPAPSVDAAAAPTADAAPPAAADASAPVAEAAPAPATESQTAADAAPAAAADDGAEKAAA